MQMRFNRGCKQLYDDAYHRKYNIEYYYIRRDMNDIMNNNL